MALISSSEPQALRSIGANNLGRWEPQTNQRDLDAAWALVETEDLSNPWVPDVLAFRDYRAASANVKTAAAELVQRGHRPSGPRLIGVPKNDSDCRSAALLPITDLVAYSYLVTSVLNGTAFPVFVSHSSLDSEQAQSEPIQAWTSIQRTLATADVPGWTLRLDVENFFVNIGYESLLRFLSQLDSRNWSCEALARFLRSWLTPRSRSGVPQGPAASRRLASVFLTQLDGVLGKIRWPSARFVDDIWILLDRREEQDYAFDLVDTACRRLGLNLSKKKTRLTRRTPRGRFLDLPMPGECDLGPATLVQVMKALDASLEQSDFIDRDVVAFLLGHLTHASAAPWPQLLRR
jgi:hypothetical protein